MEDHMESSSNSSSTHTKNLYVHSNQDTNTPHAINMARYMNLSDSIFPFQLDNDDNPVVILVIDLLITDNYATWSRAMTWALLANNVLGFITSAIPWPIGSRDSLLELWQGYNNMVVSWIQNSINPSKSIILFVDDVRDI